MSLTNPNTVVTEQRLHEYHESILPYMGGMPEVLANKFSKGDLYDTSEKMIGKWIDGKPLYQRVYTVPSTVDINANWTDIMPINTLGFKIVFAYCGGYGTGDGIYNDSFLFYVPNNIENGKVQGRLLNENIGVRLIAGVAIILQYTKNSDSANSFNIGESTDYSTDEKIVGTWIDGQPLYQKTVTYTNSSAIAQNSVTNLVLEEDATKKYIDGEFLFTANWVTPKPTYKLPYYQFARDNGSLYVEMTPQLLSGKAQIVLVTHAYNYGTNDITITATLRYTKTS